MPRSRGLTAYLLATARPYAALLAASLAARCLGLLAWAALLCCPAWAAGRIAEGHPAPGLLPLGAAMLGLGALKAACRYVEQLTGHVAAFGMLARLRVRAYDALLRLAPAVSEAPGSGRMLSAVTRDVDRIEVFYAHTLAPAITAVLVPAAAVAFAGTAAGPLPALILGAGLAAGAAAQGLIGWRGSRRSSARLVEARTRLAQEISDDVRGHREILAADAVEQRARRVDRLGERIGTLLRRSAPWTGARAAAQTGWQAATLLGLLALTLGDAPPSPVGLLLAMALVPGTAPALASVEALGRSLPAALESARRMMELERHEPAVADPPRPREWADPAGGIEVRSLSFTRPGRDDAVLRDLDLEVPAGGVVAVVGASGSGKSTLARLLVRCWDPDTGTIRVDGRPLPELPLEGLRREATLLEQHPALLSGTIREQLLLARPEAGEAEIEAACEAACLLEDLRAMPAGLDTRLGAEGARLSGGQAQRLALARGYLRRSAILILDEATSHQDPPTQRRLLERMREAAPGTVVLVAHRGAVLDHVDRVLVLEEGRVVESGSPAELRARGGAFARLMA